MSQCPAHLWQVLAALKYPTLSDFRAYRLVYPVKGNLYNKHMSAHVLDHTAGFFTIFSYGSSMLTWANIYCINVFVYLFYWSNILKCIYLFIYLIN